MSEQIIVNGNTYTLGATVGAMTGTGGTTSYFFGNLTSGQTYYFVVVAYNYAGYSGYAGPISVYTPIPPEEARPLVYVFAWDWPHSSGSNMARYWSSGNTANLITSSFDITQTGDYNWNGQGGITITGGTSDPFGGNNGYSIHVAGTANEYNTWRHNVYNLESGNTYIFSFWHYVSAGSTLTNFRLVELPSSNTGPSFVEMAMNQVLPTPTSTRSPSTEQSIQYPSSGSFSGWQRFGYEFYVGTTQEAVSCYLMTRQNSGSNVPAGFTYYLYGPQLIKGNTTSSYASTTTGGAASDIYTVKYYYEDYAKTNLRYEVGNSAWLNFAGSCGISYCFGLVNIVSKSAFEPPYTRNIDKSIWMNKAIGKLKNLPEKARAIQPNYFNTYYYSLFDSDKLSFTGGDLRQYINYDYTYSLTSSVSNYYPDPWPVTGISAMQDVWNTTIDKCLESGATIDYVFIDKEGTFFDGDYLAANGAIGNSLISGQTQYSQTWYGLTSWKDLYEGIGGTTGSAGSPTNYNYSYSPNPYFLAWSRTAQTYDAKTMDLIFKNKYLQSYSHGTISNYDDYISDPGMCGGAHDMNGHPWPRGAYSGNASSPVLYGLLGQIVSALNNNNDVWTINTTDPTRLDYFGSGLTLGIDPWTSFVQAMNEVRMAKRNAPTIPLTPWIGAASWTTERQWLKSVCWSGPNISPVEVRDQLDSLGLNGATFKFWSPGPQIPLGNGSIGYNSKEFCYYTEKGGNSAYFFELVRHTMLHGTKAIGWFNPTTFMDFGAPGISLAELNKLYNIDNLNFSNIVVQKYFMSGLTAHITEMKALDNTIQEVFDRTSGFTLTTADDKKIAWNAEWIASGAPGLNGTTWWWRITTNPNYTTTVNGTTILSATGPGMWLGTTGPTLGVEISSTPVLGSM